MVSGWMEVRRASGERGHEIPLHPLTVHSPLSTCSLFFFSPWKSSHSYFVKFGEPLCRYVIAMSLLVAVTRSLPRDDVRKFHCMSTHSLAIFHPEAQLSDVFLYHCPENVPLTRSPEARRTSKEKRRTVSEWTKTDSGSSPSFRIKEGQ